MTINIALDATPMAGETIQNGKPADLNDGILNNYFDAWSQGFDETKNNAFVQLGWDEDVRIGRVRIWGRALYDDRITGSIVTITNTAGETVYTSMPTTVAGNEGGLPYVELTFDTPVNGEILKIKGSNDDRGVINVGEIQVFQAPITGTSEDDFLEGTPEGEMIIGLDGHDFLIGYGGDDLIEGGKGFDFIEGGDGKDTLDGGSGDDTADYSNLDTAITFDGQTKVDKGANGVDKVSSVETIIGASGQANTIDGSTVVNDDKHFYINLKQNSLTIDDYGTSITYTVENFLNASGNSKKDELIGDNKDNRLIGNAGSDHLNGRGGADTLIGVDAASATPGAGERDHMTGGIDADIFVLGDEESVFYLDENGRFGGESMAMILDFESGVDKLQLSGNPVDYITRGSFIFADEGSEDGVLDSNDDMIAYVRGGFDAANDMTFV